MTMTTNMLIDTPLWTRQCRLPGMPLNILALDPTNRIFYFLDAPCVMYYILLLPTKIYYLLTYLTKQNERATFRLFEKNLKKK